jgi:hypothetical protein
VEVNAIVSDDYTVAQGFQEGQDAFSCDLEGNHAPQTEQELITYLLFELSESFQPIVLNDMTISPSPNFGFGFTAGYLHAYLAARHE